MHLRKAESHDLDAVYALICELEQGGDEHFTFEAFAPVYLRNAADDNVVYLIAEEDGKSIAFGSMHVQWLLHHAGPVAEVQELVVSEACRGKGVGVLLLDEMQAEARRRNCLQIELCCNRKREASNEFYGRRGFIKSHFKHTMKFS